VPFTVLTTTLTRLVNITLLTTQVVVIVVLGWSDDDFYIYISIYIFFFKGSPSLRCSDEDCRHIKRLHVYDAITHKAYAFMPTYAHIEVYCMVSISRPTALWSKQHAFWDPLIFCWILADVLEHSGTPLWIVRYIKINILLSIIITSTEV
jgi:hypothetical protein